jgi:hypothetical protein
MEPVGELKLGRVDGPEPSENKLCVIRSSGQFAAMSLNTCYSLNREERSMRRKR